MNETTELLKKHVSVRQFLDKKINEEQVKELILAAQSASSASFLQAYTIIGVEYDKFCLLYTSDAADEEDSVDFGVRVIFKKKKKVKVIQRRQNRK